MRKTSAFLSLVLAAAPALPATAATDGLGARLGTRVVTQQETNGRGDDLARIRRWRSFLDRAERAFFAAHMSTEAVKAKMTEADARIDELEAAGRNDPGGRSDITGDASFLERALRAFTAAHMNTADAQKWLDEAKEKGARRARG